MTILRHRLNILSRILLFYSIFIITSCTNQIEYNDFTDIAPSGWVRHDYIDFKPTITDSTALYDVYLSVRHDYSYPYTKLWLEVNTANNNNVITSKKVECNLVNEYGEWNGKGSGIIKTYDIKIASGIHIINGMQYRIKHIMSCDTIIGISNIGLYLSKTK